MTNRYQDEVIDLTESFTLVEHDNMANIIIDLDASVNDNNRPSSKIRSPKTKKHSTSKKHEQLVSPSKVEKPKKKKRYGFGNCPICFDKLGTNPMASTKCGHVFCLRCLEQALRRERKCPTCRCVLKKGGSGYHPLYLSEDS